MTRRGVNCAIAVLAALMSATPMLAGDAAAKNTKPMSTSVRLGTQTSLSGKTSKPGSYEFVADDTKVTIEQNGKTIAEAPVHWKDATTKAADSSVESDEHGIREIHFEGKTRYIEIAE